jgi:membrane protein DedA with SNARE-associated domain/membrane-associated phospholipid phosphatase
MLDWVVQHPHLAGAVIFLVATAESLAGVGLLFPGTVVMFGAGALVGKGILELWPTLAWAAAGAMMGDGLSYWLGHRYRERLREFWPFSRHPALLQKGEAFFLRYGGKSVLFGRFVGPVRPVVPVVAGMLGMSPVRFYLANVLSALAWAPAHILPGVVFGAALSLAAAVSMRLALLLAVLVVLPWLVVAVTRIAATWLKPRLKQALARLNHWAVVPGRPMHNLAAALIDPTHPEAGALALFAGVLIGASWALMAVLEDVFTRDTLMRADSSVFHLLQGLRTPAGDAVMIALTELGDAAVMLPLIVIVLGWLLWSRAWRAAAYWLAAVAFGGGLTLALKAGFHLPRPAPLYEGLSSFAFPSGHAAMSVVIYGFLGVLIGRGISPRSRVALASTALLLVSLIAFSRLYLGAHWLSDVLGGLAFGTAWVALLAIAYLRRSVPATRTRGLAVAALVTLLVAGVWHVSMQHAADTERYAQRVEIRIVTASDWWDSSWLPPWRVDLEGEYEQPIAFQWAGSPVQLKQVLMAHGWQEPVPLAAGNWLLWLDVKRPAVQLPVLPNSHDGRNEVQTLIREVQGVPSQRLVLRLWPTRFQLQASAQPIWAGTVVRETIAHPLGWFDLPRADARYDEPRDVLQQSLDGLSSRLVQRSGLELTTAEHRAWDGKVLLAREPGLSLP